MQQWAKLAGETDTNPEIRTAVLLAERERLDPGDPGDSRRTRFGARQN